MTIEKVNPIHILPNGVKCYDLEEIVNVNYVEAQDILDSGNHTNVLDAECAYVERVGNPFIGTYEIPLFNNLEYRRFIQILTDTHSMEYIPTFQEWQNNKVTINGRTMRLAKWLNKEAVCDSIIDLYSAQPKGGNDVAYLTISDLPQHIVGMSYNASDWHSCQHPDSAESVSLGGSLHDDTLLVAMMHDSMDDLLNMEKKLLARVNMRIMDIDGIRHLTPSRYYGSVSNRAMLHECLTHLEALRIHSRAVRFDTSSNDINDMYQAKMENNGSYEMELIGNEWYYNEIDETVSVDCPCCTGTGSIEIHMEVFNKEVSVSCPMCYGEGKYEMEINVCIETEVEAEEEAELITYTDDYEIEGNFTYMTLSKNYLSKHWEKFPK